MHLFAHLFKLFFGELGNTCLLELFKSSPDGFVTNKDSFADFTGRAWQIVNFGSNQDGSTTQTGRSSTLAHPVSLHPLDKFSGSHSDFSGLVSKLEHFTVS